MLRPLIPFSARWLTSLLVLLFCSPANAYYFLNPPPHRNTPGNHRNDDIYHIGDLLHVQWHAPKSSKVLISLWQAAPNATPENIFPSYVAGLHAYPWIVKTAANLTESDRFFLAMYTEGDRSLVATSRQFIIKYHSLHANQTTGDSGPAAANGTRALDGSVPSTSNSTAAADGQAASASRAGLSTGAKAGIGVGVAIAVLGAVFAFFIIRYLKKRKISADDNLSSLTSDPTLLSNTSPAVHSSNLRSGPAMTSETIMTPKTRLRANSPRELENQETTGPAELPVSEHGQSQL